MLAYLGSLLPCVNLLTGIIYLVLAGYILSQNYRSRINIACTLYLLSFAVWSFAAMGLKKPNTSIQVAHWSQNLAVIGWSSFTSIYLWFVLTLTTTKKYYRSWLALALFILPPILFTYLQWNGYMIVDYRQDWFGWVGVWSMNVWPFVFYAYSLIVIIISQILLLRYWFKTTNYYKKRMVWILFVAMNIAYLGSIIFDVIVPQLEIASIPQGSQILMLLWAFALVYSIAYYRFLNISPSIAGPEIFRIIPDCLILLDQNKQIVALNKYCRQKLGYTLGDLEGQDISQILVQSPAAQQIVQAIADNRDLIDREVKIRTKKNQTLSFVVNCSLIRDRYQNVIGIAFFAKNITKLKQVKKQLSNKIKELNRLNQAMTGRQARLDELKLKINRT